MSKTMFARSATGALLAWALVGAACTKSQPVPGGLGDACLGNGDCATGFLCSGGQCVLPSNLGGCEPGRLRCNGPDIELCASTGQGWERQDTCATGCSGGACRPPVCSPNARRCEGDISEVCAPAGEAWLILQACPSHCDPATGACKAPVCTPFSTTCSPDGTKVLVCDAYGAQQLEQACGAQAICESGRCRPNVCTGGATRCTGDAAEQCTPSGEAWALVQLCATGCEAGACKAQICTPFSTSCADSSTLLTCSSNGTLNTSSACGAQTVCDNGRCRPSICTAGALRCSNGASEQCVPDGSAWALLEVCPATCDAGSGRCKAPVCTPFGSRCDLADRSKLYTCDAIGSSEAVTPCGSGNLCDNGRCQTVICTPGALRCAASGHATELCDALGLSYQVQTPACDYGCAASSATVAACKTPACALGESRCAAGTSALEACLPDRTGFSFVSFCATGCQAVTPATTPPTAQCKVPVCAPFDRRCQPDPQAAPGVQSCLADGSGYQTTETCPQACAAGACVTSSAGCTAGELRCNGADAQLCTSASAGVTAWTVTATCLAGCSSGACLPGGSCVPFSLQASVATAPADGLSTVLVSSGTIRGADGALVPDGVLFNVVLPTGAGAPAFASVDASPELPGVQVRSLGGALDFVLQAPLLTSGVSTAPIAVQVAQSATCAGTASLGFDSALPAAGTVLVAEDFSTSTRRDLSKTTADWSTTSGWLRAAWPGDVGDGRDGDLIVDVTSGAGICTSPCDLSQAGYAPSYAVLGLEAAAATVDGVAQGLSGGDEVLLWDVQGSSAGATNAGTYELLTVAQASGSRVEFTSAVHGTYGATTDQNVQSQKVVLQRVPHFGSLSVKAGSKLVAAAWDGTRGGLVFLRATGTVTVAGGIDVSAKGFRGGSPGTVPTGGEDQTGPAGQTGAGGGAGQSAAGQGAGASYGTAGVSVGAAAAGATYGLPLLGRLFLGAGGGAGGAGAPGGAGGGAIVVSAGSVVVASGGTGLQANAASPLVSSAGGGAGGSVWLSSPVVDLQASAGVQAKGTPAATNVRAGGQGRVRVDWQAPSAPSTGACSAAAPACVLGVNGALIGQSLEAYAVPSGSSVVLKEARLVLALVSPAGATPTFFAAGNTSDPADFGQVPASGADQGLVRFVASGSPLIGSRFRWKASFSPAPGAPITVRGLQWQLKVQ